MRLTRTSWFLPSRRAGASLTRLLFAMVATLAVLSSQVQVVVHLATVQHVVCAEHDGAVEDVRSVHTDAAEGHDERDGASLANAPDADHGHQDCSLLGLGATALPHHLHAELPEDPHLAGTDAPAPDQLGARGPPLLSLAPKLSPPRV